MDDNIKEAAPPRVKRFDDQAVEGRKSSLLNPEDVRMFQ